MAQKKRNNQLVNWKINPNKKPLIIYGARQVGKTYLINEFGKNNYDYVNYLNFEFDVNAKKILKIQIFFISTSLIFSKFFQFFLYT